jgi:hypothetical protein
MENKTSPQTKETVGQTVEQVRQSSRRTFLTLTVAASGGGRVMVPTKASGQRRSCGAERRCSLDRDSSQVLIFRREPG